MKRHRQTVTLQVDFDLTNIGPPESWPWNENPYADVLVLAAGPVEKIAPPTGFALAMAVLQSPEYHKLDDAARAECDALIAAGQAVV